VVSQCVFPSLEVAKEFVQNAMTINLLNIFWIMQVHSLFTHLTKIFWIYWYKWLFVHSQLWISTTLHSVIFQTEPVFILFYIFILLYTISQTTSWTHSPTLGPQYTTQEYIMSSNIMGSLGLCHYNKHDSFVHTGQQSVVWFGERGIYMCRVLPKLIPLWVAPLLLPYWRLIIPWPARICSSEKFRTFFSASLGPMLGLP
jgi:hypothetical protein